MTIGTTNFPAALDTASELIRAVNVAESTIGAGGVNASATTVPVTSTTPAPADGVAYVGTEAISYTGKTATTLTGCVRGFDGTTAASHAAGDPVFFDPVVARFHNVLAEAIIAVQTKLGAGVLAAPLTSGGAALPALELQSRSDTSTDQGIVRLRRAPADGVSALPSATEMGQVLFQGRNATGGWYNGSRLVAHSRAVNGDHAFGQLWLETMNDQGVVGSYLKLKTGSDGGEIEFGCAVFELSVGDEASFSALNNVDIGASSGPTVLRGVPIRLVSGWTAELDFAALDADHVYALPNVNGTFAVLTDPALAELIRDTIAAALVAGSNVTITPSDPADTITIAASGGGGGSLTVSEDGTPVDTTVTTLDFDGSDFNLTESPEDEINISLNYGTGAGQPAEGNHAHAGVYQPLDADLTDIAAIADAQGDVIIRGVSGWERLAAGTSGHFLKTNGAGANPAWAAAAGGGSGGLVFINSNTFSAQSSVSLDSLFSSTYENYFVLIRFLTSAAAQLRARFRSAGADDSGNTYRWMNARDFHNGSSGIDRRASGGLNTFITLNWDDTVNDPGVVALYISSPNIADDTGMTIQGSSLRPSDNLMVTNSGSGFAMNSTQYTGFSIFPSTGNITGSIKIYGLADS